MAASSPSGSLRTAEGSGKKAPRPTAGRTRGLPGGHHGLDTGNCIRSRVTLGARATRRLLVGLANFLPSTRIQCSVVEGLRPPCSTRSSLVYTHWLGLGVGTGWAAAAAAALLASSAALAAGAAGGGAPCGPSCWVTVRATATATANAPATAARRSRPDRQRPRLAGRGGAGAAASAIAAPRRALAAALSPAG